jgi:hypothetical protein
MRTRPVIDGDQPALEPTPAFWLPLGGDDVVTPFDQLLVLIFSRLVLVGTDLGARHDHEEAAGGRLENRAELRPAGLAEHHLQHVGE